MIDHRTPFVCFLTDNEAHNVLCLRYWSVSSAGEWSEDFNTLVSDSGLSSYKLTNMLKLACRAYALHHRCPECGRPIQVEVRTGYFPSTGRFPRSGRSGAPSRCAVCVAAPRAANRKTASPPPQRDGGLPTRRLDRLNDEAGAIDYASLDLVTSCLLSALFAAANIGPYNRVFTLNGLLAARLAPSPELSDSICSRLYEDGILLPAPTPASHGLSLNRKASPIKIDAQAAAWTLADDSKGRSVEQIKFLLAARLEQPEPEPATTLWYFVAENECRRYFVSQAQRYRFTGAEIYTVDVAFVIVDSLHRFSIGQMCNIIYYMFKDLAALAQKGAYERQRIYDMIPETIRRYADDRLGNRKSVYPWSRRPTSESWLSSILLDTVLKDGDAVFETVNGSDIAVYVRGLLTGRRAPP